MPRLQEKAPKCWKVSGGGPPDPPSERGFNVNPFHTLPQQHLLRRVVGCADSIQSSWYGWTSHFPKSWIRLCSVSKSSWKEAFFSLRSLLACCILLQNRQKHDETGVRSPLHRGPTRSTSAQLLWFPYRRFYRTPQVEYGNGLKGIAFTFTCIGAIRFWERTFFLRGLRVPTSCTTWLTLQWSLVKVALHCQRPWPIWMTFVLSCNFLVGFLFEERSWNITQNGLILSQGMGGALLPWQPEPPRPYTLVHVLGSQGLYFHKILRKLMWYHIPPRRWFFLMFTLKLCLHNISHQNESINMI